MKIELLHSESCHVWQEALEILEKALSARNFSGEIRIVVIKTQKDAEKHKFAGSPQIKIDGRDVDPMAGKIRNYTVHSCRQYFYRGRVYEYPPKEMILEALKTNALQK